MKKYLVLLSCLLVLLTGCSKKQEEASSTSSTTISSNRDLVEKKIDDVSGLKEIIRNGLGVFYEPNAAACSKIIDISRSTGEGAAQKFNVAVSAVKFLRISNFSDGSGCSVIVDTPVGPKQCQIGSVLKNEKGEYLITPYLFIDGGKKYTDIANACGEVN